MHETDEIHSIPSPHCKVCGFSGIMTYKGLSDRLFAVPGLWNLKKCENNECGLIWLDPMPLEEDIHKAYSSYYTHGDEAALDQTFNQRSINVLTRIFRLFLKITPMHRERLDIDLLYTGYMKTGKLLEVGCGDGTRLTKFKALGWDVEGQEVDPVSAMVASKKGMKIHLGFIEKLGLKDESFDAIVMNHVIEHVHDPVKLLSECRRILRKDGFLVAVTPNSRSLGHRLFRSNWRGLEPPRHVMVHCQNSLKKVANSAGFHNVMTLTTAARGSFFALGSSQSIFSKKTKILTNIFCYISTALFVVTAIGFSVIRKDYGEECILMVKKNNSDEMKPSNIF